MHRAALQGWLLLAVTAGICGCGDDSASRSAPSAQAPQALAGEAADAGRELAGARFAVIAGAEQGPPAANDAALRRKIISNAHMELVVEDFDGIPEQIALLAKKAGGFVADSTLTGASGENRRGQWKLRVPAAHLDELLSATQQIGELVSVATNSQDVSEEYYDVEARIRNKTKEEERLLKLLDDRPGKLDEILNIERELSRVRDEIERMQGRMRVLNDLTSLSTVQITIREMHGYLPPEAPRFATRLRRAFVGSLESIGSAAEWSLITSAKAAPWLVLGLGLMSVFAVLRRRRRRRTPSYHGSV